MMKTIIFLFAPILLFGQQGTDDAFFILKTSEACQGESPILLEGFMLENSDEPLPEGGVFKIETCVPDPCADAIIFDAQSGEYFFDATVPEGSYIISYTVGNPPFERKFFTQFDLQAANAQILVLQNRICQNELLQIQVNPLGGHLSGPGVVSMIVNDDEFFFFDPNALSADSIYNLSYSYSITASSGLVCSDVSEQDIEVRESLEIDIGSDTLASCSLENLPIDIDVVGDTTQMEVVWYNPSFDSIYNALDIVLDTLTTSGFYYVEATNANECGDLESVYLQVYNIPQVECIRTTEVSCFGGSDGSLRVINDNPDLDLAAAWLDGDSTFIKENLSAGFYSVTVTTAEGCNSICSFTLSEPESLVVNCKDALRAPTCYAGNDGTNLLAITGGTEPYRTSLDDIVYTATAELSELVTGNYAVYVLDANDCMAECSFTIPESEPDSCSIALSTAVSCHNGSDGSLSVIGSGGQQSVLWSTGDSSTIAAGLSAGTYSVTVTSDLGCTSVCVSELLEPEQLAIELTAVQHPTCFGEENGTIEIEIAGGTPPYTYLLNGMPTNNQNVFEGLAKGDYTIVVLDMNGCSSELQTSLENPQELSGEIEIESELLCHGHSNGILTLSTSAEIASLLWNTGDTTKSITNVVEGLYSVTISDVSDCELVLSQYLEQPPLLELSEETVIHNFCYGQSEGYIELSVLGGVGDYNYIWSHGANTPQVENLSSGTYTVFIADANNCLLMESYEISEPEDIVVELNTIEPSCYDLENGTLSVSSDIPKLSYVWNTGDTTAMITGQAGAYEVLVTTLEGCEKKLSAFLQQPDPLIIGLTSKQGLSCHDSADAFLEITISGGTAPYEILWEDASTQLTRSNLKAGTYEVVVTDDMNCSETALYVIESLDRITVTADLIHPDCYGLNTGSISLVSDIELDNTELEWSLPEVQNVLYLDSLAAGTYSVRITFPDGCQQAYSYTLEDNPPLELSELEVFHVDCYGHTSGRIVPSVTGGTAPYSYLWSNGLTTREITNLPSSDYSVTVTDSYGCAISSSAISVIQNDSWTAELANVDACMDEAIRLSVVVNGRSVEELEYDWTVQSNKIGADTSMLEEHNLNTVVFDSYGLETGSVKIVCTITDEHGCTEVVTAELTLDCCFDLALRKQVVGPSRVEKGEPVEFTIEVFNQGSIAAYDIVIEDFPAAGLLFLEEKNTAKLTGNPYDWTLVNGDLTTRIDSIAALSLEKLSIYFQVEESTEQREFLNEAEIIDYSSIYRHLPCDEDEALSEDPEESNDDISDDSNGSEDNPKDDDQKDYETVTVCPTFDHTLTMALCGTPTFELLLDENLRAALDPEGDGDGNQNDGDTGNEIISFHSNLAETLSMQASTMQSLLGMEMLYARMITSDNCVVAVPLNLDIYALPHIPSIEEEIVVTVDEEITLSIDPVSTYSYQWQVGTPQGFKDLIGETSATLYLGAATIEHDNKSYRVQVTQENPTISCTSTSAETLIRVLPEVLVCNGSLNVSLDQSCQLALSVSQLLQSPVGNTDFYEIQYFDTNNQPISTSELETYLGRQIRFRVSNLLNNSSCWGNLRVEDKTAPMLDCPETLILSCTDTTDILSHLALLPEDNCSEASLVVSDSTPALECFIENGQNFTKSRRITIWAEDAYGNRTSPCDIQINYEAMDALSLSYPEHLQLENHDWDLNGNDYPDPEETGTITDQAGAPLEEQVLSQCNIKIHYEDVSYPLCGNSYMVLREWTVVDWCRQNVENRLQFIKVLDTRGPALDSTVVDSVMYISGAACFTTFTPEPLHAADKATVSSFRLSQYRQNDADSIYIQQAIYPHDSIPTLELDPGIYRFDYEYFDFCGESAIGQYYVDVRKNTFISAVCRETLNVNLDSDAKIRLWAEELDNYTLGFCDVDLSYGIRIIPESIQLVSEPEVYEIDGKRYYKSIDVDASVDSIELAVFYKNQYSLCRTDLVNSASKKSSVQNGSRVIRRAVSESVSTYPNPFSNELYIAINVSERQKIQLDLYSLDGRNVYSKAFIIEQGEQHIRITEEQLLAGNATYMLVVHGKTIAFTTKVIQLR